MQAFSFGHEKKALPSLFVIYSKIRSSERLLPEGLSDRR